MANWHRSLLWLPLVVLLWLDTLQRHTNIRWLCWWMEVHINCSYGWWLVVGWWRWFWWLGLWLSQRTGNATTPFTCLSTLGGMLPLQCDTPHFCHHAWRCCHCVGGRWWCIQSWLTYWHLSMNCVLDVCTWCCCGLDLGVFYFVACGSNMLHFAFHMKLDYLVWFREMLFDSINGKWWPTDIKFCSDCL